MCHKLSVDLKNQQKNFKSNVQLYPIIYCFTLFWRLILFLLEC